ncbi:MAG: SusC/RagA family TonB-linked outer membrane protein [Bacteroidota bacterium]|nr:SusC/RagA family TonB-linked outer membrane protein [Bacteroidota bacterium]
MKLSCLLIFLAMFQVSAKASGQSPVTLHLKNVEISRLLGTLEKETGYHFLFNSRLPAIHKLVDVDADNVDIRVVLDHIFLNTGLTYKMLDDKLIVISPTADKLNDDIVITGTVTGENGEPLSGVSVTVKNTTAGSTTNNNGSFTLSAPENAVLVISYVGYITQEVPVNNQNVLNVKLVPSAAAMEQVVVVGYGTQRKIDVTGATATVKGSELVKQQVLTPTEAIQGKVAGVQITGSGQPGSQPSIRIRGTGSLLGGSEPLYVVDGIITNDILNINNTDIVSVDILKDASSTAIYGARGANGVIIITTKRGVKGKMQINYNGYVGTQSATHLVKMANAKQYADYVSDATYGVTTVPVTGYSTDWFSKILRNAIQQNHSVSVSGASDKTNYLLSVGYADNQGIVIGNDFKRYTIRSNNEFQLANHLKLGIDASYSNNNNQNVNLGTAYNDAYKAAPIIAGRVNGKYGNTSLYQNVGNPILDINNVNSRTLNNRLQGNAFLEYKPLSWLTLKSSLGADWNNLTNRNYNYQFFADTATFLTAGGNQSNPTSSLSMISVNALHWVWDNTATLNKRFGDHNLTLLIGTTAEKITSTSLEATAHGVPADPDLWYIHNADNSLPFSNDGQGTIQTRNSYIARLNYSYRDRYLFTGNFRADGSSTFPAQNRWGYFPSLGVGWVISKEGFMQNQRIFDVLKIRGSWGQAGNDVTGTGSQGYTLTLLQNLPYFFGGSSTSGSAISQIVDQNLKWETSTESDAAVEFSMLKSRLSGEFSYYDKTTKNSVINVLVPSTLGSFNPSGSAGYVLTNAASVENRGVELGLNWRDDINKDFSYSIGANITFNKNQVVGLNGGQPYIDGPIGANQAYVTKTDNGQPIGSFYVQKVLGVFQSLDDVDNYKDKNGNILQSNAQPGDFKYEYNSSGKLDSVFAGSYQPKAYYGVNIGINYKNITLSVSGYGTQGGKIYNGKKAYRSSLSDNIEASTYEKMWTNSNHSQKEPRANGGSLPASTYFVESGSYFRINNINIGYNLSPAILKKTRVLSSFQVYVAAQNLFTFTSYSGFTPELQPNIPTSASLTNAAPTTGSATNAGIELNAYPAVKTISVGVNLGF